jgi:hypothetical protein
VALPGVEEEPDLERVRLHSNVKDLIAFLDFREGCL